jgi:proprotein convertase subtilisin/kexin type 5
VDINLFKKHNVYIPSGLFNYVVLQDASNIFIEKTYISKNSDFYYVKRCELNCLACNSKIDCLKCSPGYFVQNGTCSQCSSFCLTCIDNDLNCLSFAPNLNCKENEFYFYEDDQCVECPVGCSRCSSNLICSKCYPDHYLKNDKCLPVDPCKLNDSSSSNMVSHKSCAKCSSNCAYCNSVSFNCKLCNHKYFLDGNQCKACPLNCQVCSDSKNCLRCDPNYELHQTICRKKLEQNKIKNEKENITTLINFENESDNKNEETPENNFTQEDKCLILNSVPNKGC